MTRHEAQRCCFVGHNLSGACILHLVLNLIGVPAYYSWWKGEAVCPSSMLLLKLLLCSTPTCCCSLQPPVVCGVYMAFYPAEPDSLDNDCGETILFAACWCRWRGD